MIDLRNIAQQLRLPADQLRLAADLLEQGYQPAFIARYRADETGQLPSGVLWAIKFAMEREHQLSTARQEALNHLGEGVELDEEAQQKIERASSIVGIDVAVRCFPRATSRSAKRRTIWPSLSAAREKMIAATGPIENLHGMGQRTIKRRCRTERKPVATSRPLGRYAAVRRYAPVRAHAANYSEESHGAHRSAARTQRKVQDR